MSVFTEAIKRVNANRHKYRKPDAMINLLLDLEVDRDWEVERDDTESDSSGVTIRSVQAVPFEV